MVIDRVWFENLFRREDVNSHVFRVLEMTEEPATGKGDNYLSQVTRITLKLEISSGIRTQMTFIAKHIPEELIEMVKGEGFFDNEIVTYKILSRMEQLMKSRCDTRDRLWCHMIGYTDKDIVFEDLGADGFKTVNKSEKCSKEESIWALTTIARFHAMGLALMEQNVPEIKQLLKCFLVDEKKQTIFMHQPLRSFRDAVKSTWGPAWTDTVEFLDEMLNNIGQILEDVEKASSLNVLVHGDCWSGNIMFKKDFSGKILSTKLIDFQQTCVHNFAHDLSLFIHNSIKREIRSRKTYEDLLRAYHDSLVSNVKFYQLNIKMPSFDEIVSIMERLRPFSFLVMCLVWPFENWDMDLSKGKENEQPIFSPMMYESDQTKNILGCELRKLMNKVPFFDLDEVLVEPFTEI